MKIYLAMLCVLLLAVSAHARQSFDVPVMSANLGLYNDFVAEKGGDPLLVGDFSSENSNRVVADMVLIQQALRLGGLDVHLNYYGTPNPARAEEDVKQGLSALLAYETWESNFDDRVFKSDAIIGDGEFLKVIVGRSDNRNGLMKVKTLDELRKLTAVTGHRWRIDRKTLQAMGVDYILLVPRYALQFKVLHERHADFGLYEYANILKEAPEELSIVPGITVGLRGSRHFMVSRSHPMGPTVFGALQRGIAILKSRGAFKKAYKECGFFSEKLETWKRIYP